MNLRALPWLVCAVLALLAAILKFVIPGYSFSALVCLCLLGIIAFYAGAGLLRPRFPTAILWLRRVFTVCLAAGLLVVGITEAVIVHASFGDPDQRVEYMVVLGAKVRDDGPSVSLWDRIYAAADYLNAHPGVTAILSGGQGADEPMTEAQAMYDALTDLGVDPARLWLEDRATSTWENINFTLDLVESRTGQRPKRLGVLSSEYHLFRASLFARACGVEEFVGIPARTSRLAQAVNHFMREVAGVWHYLLLGGQYE